MTLLKEYLAHFGIQPDRSPRKLLENVVAAYASLPYENITKIIKKTRRTPSEVIRDHIAWGTGGTCFSLTSALMQLVSDLGWEPQYILADRLYGQNTHCALLVWIEGMPHLVDPGFLITKPIPISFDGEREIETGFNRLILTPDREKGRISLSTIRQGAATYRLSYKTTPVDPGEFFKAWDDSFGWDMMRYLLLTRTVGSSQMYLRGAHLRISSPVATERREILEDDLIPKIAAEFKIHPSVIRQAVLILKEGGENIGKASDP
jgi:arylamine N-acetyltransferase